MRRVLRSVLWVALLLDLTSTAALAQEVSVSMRPQAVQVGERAELSVTVEGTTDVDSEPRVPPVPGLRFRRTGQQTSFSSVNGRMSRSIAFGFLVTAEKVGEYDIGPIEVGIGGRTVRAPNVKFSVVPAGRAPASGAGVPDASRPESAEEGMIFVEAIVDDSSVYVGEQVTLRLRFHQASGFVVRETQLEEPPTTRGFLREEIPPQRTSTARVGGRTYQVTELVYALFPTQVGQLEIGPARLRCVVQDRRRRRRDRFDIFGIFEEREVQLRSKPISIEVRALPRPQPADFGGGVGRFRMTSELDRTELRQNEPVTLTVSIEGTGNISALDQPNWPEPPSFRSFDPTAPEVRSSKSNDKLGGKKTFRLVLVPETTGTLAIPPVTTSFFRPDRGRYETLSGDTLRVNVLPGDASASGGEITRLGRDLRTIRETTELEVGAGIPPWKRPLFWGWNLLPLSLVGAAWVTRRRREHERIHGTELARKRAPGRLRKAMTELQKSSRNDEEKLAQLEESWADFLRDRYSFSLRGRKREDLVEELRAAGCPDKAIGAVEEVLQALDFARFAPGRSGEVDALIRRSAEVAVEMASGAPPSAPPKSGLGLLVLLGLAAGATLGSSGLPEVSAAVGATGKAGARSFVATADAATSTAADLAAEATGDEANRAPEEVRNIPNASPPEERFREANRFYLDGDYSRAVAAYSELLDEGFQSADLWLNLGNSWYRAGEKGRAIHAYESGLRLDPGDIDLRTNLELSREDIEPERTIPGNRFLEWLSASRERLPLHSFVHLVSVLWWITMIWASAALLRRLPGRLLTLLGLALAGLWGLSVVWLGVALTHDRTRPDMVVIEEAVAVRSNPDPAATVEFNLPQGTAFRSGRIRAGHVEVLYSEDLHGWADRGRIATIGRPLGSGREGLSRKPAEDPET